MASIRTFRGYVVQTDVPSWSPLERALGTDLAHWFMWMHEIRLDDGTRLDAYKHTTTRRYLHLGGDGAAFVWRFDSTYRPINLADAILAAFGGWEHARPPLTDRQMLRAAVERIRSPAA